MASWLSDYREGCFIDSKDTMNTWCVGKIINIDKEQKTIKIRYEGWSDKWDNTFPFNSNRIAQFRLKSELYTGQKGIALRSFYFDNEYLKSVAGKMENLPSSAFEMTQFLRGELFILVDCLLVYDYKNPVDLSQSIEFFTKTIDFIVNWLKSSRSHFQILNSSKPDGFLTDPQTALSASWPELLFTLKRLFALDQRTAKSLPSWTSIPESYKFSPETEYRAKTLYYLINYFHSIGGFQTILDIFSNPETCKLVPLNFIIILPVFEIRYFLTKPFEQHWTKQFKEGVLERIRAISEKELKKIEKNTVYTILELVKPLFDSSEANLEEIELEIIKKFIKCPYMEKRLKGLNDLRGLIDLILSKDPTKKKLRTVNGESLARWIVENQILESIMHHAHEEMVKRASPVFNFTIMFRYLNENHINLLWNHAKDHHDSIQSAVYLVIVDISKLLDKNMQKLLFDKFISVGIDEFDEKLTETFTEFIKKSEWLSESAMEFLYKLIIEGLPSQYELFCNSFTQILGSYSDQQITKVYLEKAVQNIKNEENIFQSFLIIMKILKIQMSSVLKNELYRKLKSLTNGVVNLIIDSLSKYKNSESVPQSHDLKIRMKFWKFLMIESAFEVRIDELVSTKNAFCELNHPKARKKFWKIFLELVQQKFSIDVNALIYAEMFLSKDPGEVINEDSFEVFLSLFLRVNYYSRNIDIKHEKFHSRLQVTLNGYEFLVKCIFETSSVGIQEKAMRFLTSVNLKLSRSLLPKSEEIWRSYIEILQTYLDKSSDRVKKSLKLVFQFLQGFAQREVLQEDCTVMFKSSNEGEFNKILLNSGTDIATVRKKVADFYKKTNMNVFLVTSQGEKLDNLYDDFVLSTWKPPYFFTVDYTQPLNFLTSSQFFVKCEKFQLNLLETLPALEKESAELAWMILKKVPLIEKYATQFKTFGVTFTKILKTPCIYQLVYSLKIIEGLIHKPQWLQEFKKVGGIDQIQSIFIESSLDSDCSLILEYNTLVLSILSAIIAHIENFSSLFITKVLHTLVQSAKLCNESEESGYIAKNVKEILACCRQQAKEVFLSTLKSFPIPMLLQATLIDCACSYFSTTMSTFFLEQSQSAPELNLIFLNNILDLLEPALTCNKSDTYWNLLSFYINDCELTEELKLKYLSFFKHLENYPAENKSKDPDLVLSGLLKVLKTIIQKLELKANPQLISLILHSCLFETPSANNRNAPKCKHSVTRRDAFDLLQYLCRDEFALDYVLEYLKVQYSDPSWRSTKHADWNYHPQTHEKSETGFVGMKNLGCICYMISSLQQLYYISQFRETLLRMGRNDEPLEENLLYQLQSLFSGLKNSDKQHVNPKGICRTFKDWEGKPVSLTEQMDADEFINTFMDRIESKISKLPGGDIIKSIFTGQLATELIGQSSCVHRSEVSEAFITLPVQVKNQKSLYESLETFKQGEVLQGSNAYQCDHCDSKVTAIRRVCIKSLPNVLLITLRRFEFDYDTMKRVKLNDYCEFPNELNMEKYTQEGIEKAELAKENELAGIESNTERKYPEEYYQYKLRGIIIHLGTAENGHYYSFIRENGQWYEFNDTVVRKIDASDLPNEAFGGEEKFSFQSNPAFKCKNRNAYILLYERSEYFVYSKEDEQIRPWNLTINSNEVEFSEVKEENDRYWRCRSSFSPEYFDFVINLLDRNSEKSVKFIISFFFTVMIRSRDYGRIVQCLRKIKELLKNNKKICEWVLEIASVQYVLKELLMDCPITQKRRVIVGFLSFVAKQTEESMQKIFFSRLLGCLDLARKPKSNNFCQYFELLSRIVNLNPTYIEKFNLSIRLMNYLKKIPQDPETIPDHQHKDIYLGYDTYKQDEKVELSIGIGGSSLIFLLEILKKLELTTADKDFLFIEENLSLFLNEAESRFAGQTIGKFYANLCKDNKLYSTKYGNFLVDGIDRVNHNKHKPYMRQLFELMSLQDSLTVERTDFLLLKYLRQIQNNKKYPLATESSVDFLLKLAFKVPAVRDALKKRKNDLKFLNTNLPEPANRVLPTSKEPFIVKNSSTRLENLKKLLKGQFGQMDLEESDGETFNSDFPKHKTLEYFEVQIQKWVPCQIVCNYDELICIRTEHNGVNHWVDSLSDYLRLINIKKT